MRELSSKQLILSLIQDDLLNQKLINNLRDIGIDAGDYHLNLGSTIFRLMGIPLPADDMKYDEYMELVALAKYFPLHGDRNFSNYALDIYAYLESLQPRPSKLYTMKQQISKSQIIRLITMDLLNIKLTTKLSEIPLVPDHYMLGIDEIVFEVMGIEELSDTRVDQVYRNYAARAIKVRDLQVPFNQDRIDELAEELYDYLESESV
ncbi:hypothetical protein [Fluviicola taffensis]|uniref:Uncharacterized protein n=1 Tax=Fluviicola taffensis (strain DSM 16823 / NCIMB 13979 / RW262) TaxID=755732 RepID=F2IJU3_FLUTR|nr:hypothetical protein [Fluviicola taffensis]AEA45002.1 hypothetical protein Fluta_3024 [Fluviicola taffensis DSM 16823]